MSIPQIYYDDGDVEGCRRHFLKVARELCYGENVLQQIREANKVYDIEQIMIKARKN